MTFGTCWDGFGMVWGIFFGWVWEGLGKVRQGRKINIFKNAQEGFSRVGTPGNSSLVTKIEERNTHHLFFVPIFLIVLLVSYQPGAGGRGPWPLG